MTDKPYGYSLHMSLADGDVGKFNRKGIRRYFRELCVLIGMKRCKLVWWDDVGVPEEEQQIAEHTKGTSAVQFILTSGIMIHTLVLTGKVYVDMFTCKEYDEDKAKEFTADYFNGRMLQCVPLVRP